MFMDSLTPLTIIPSSLTVHSFGDGNAISRFRLSSRKKEEYLFVHNARFAEDFCKTSSE
jgi:hypothetical protein